MNNIELKCTIDVHELYTCMKINIYQGCNACLEMTCTQNTARGRY